MTGETERHPLLPRHKQSPEIQGGEVKSFVDANPTEAAPGDEKASGRPRCTSNDLGAVLLAICIVCSLAMLFLPEGTGDQRPGPRTISQRVNKILENGHNDLAIVIRAWYHNKIYDAHFTEPFEGGGMYGHVDIPRLRKGKNGGAFWSAFAPCPSNGTDFSDANYAETVAFTYSQIDVLKRLQAAYPAVFSPPPNSSTAVAAFKSGQLISPLGIEGLHQIGNSLANLRSYYALGVRYATLTHNCHNIYADSALTETPSGLIPSTPLHRGLSSSGRLLIREMNRLGMIVDLAHVSQDTMRAALQEPAAPAIFSHSSAHALCPHPRNVPDSILHLVAATRSLVMVNFAPDFISCVPTPGAEPGAMPQPYERNATLHQVVRHVMHIGELIGYEHVGLGSDFDGIPRGPRGLEDVSQYPNLVAEMLRMGVSDEDVERIVGGNILRVWKEVDAIATRMRREGVRPVEDDLPSLRF